MLGQPPAQDAMLLVGHLRDQLADAALARAHLHPLADHGPRPIRLEREPPPRRRNVRIADGPAEQAFRVKLADRGHRLPKAASLMEIAPTEPGPERRAGSVVQPLAALELRAELGRCLDVAHQLPDN